MRFEQKINREIRRSCLEELASREEQERLWLARGNAENEMSTFGEAWCCLFGDSGLDEAMEAGWIKDYYGADVVSMVNHLRSLLREVPPHLSDEDIISLPLMVEIRTAARRLLDSPLSRE